MRLGDMADISLNAEVAHDLLHKSLFCRTLYVVRIINFSMTCRQRAGRGCDQRPKPSSKDPKRCALIFDEVTARGKCFLVAGVRWSAVSLAQGDCQRSKPLIKDREPRNLISDEVMAEGKCFLMAGMLRSAVSLAQGNCQRPRPFIKDREPRNLIFGEVMAGEKCFCRPDSKGRQGLFCLGNRVNRKEAQAFPSLQALVKALMAKNR